jgi:hypothetical protein
MCYVATLELLWLDLLASIDKEQRREKVKKEGPVLPNHSLADIAR